MADDLTPTGLPRVKRMRKPVFRPSNDERRAMEADNPYWEGPAELESVVDEFGNPVDPMMGARYGSAFVNRETSPRRTVDSSLNPYTGRPLSQTPIFGGAGTISEAFAVPPEGALTVRNPFTEEALNDTQKRRAAAEIESIQRVMTRNKRQEAEKLFGGQWRNAQRLIASGMLNESQVQQIKQQMQTQLESYDTPSILELFETAQAEDNPEVQLAKTRSGYRDMISKRYGDPEFANLASDLLYLDPKTGKVNDDRTQSLIKMQESVYQEEARAKSESRKTKEGAYASLLLAARNASEKESLSHTLAYYKMLDDFENEYGPLGGVKPPRPDDEPVDLAAELKYLSSGRKVKLLPRSPDGYVDLVDDEDEQAAQAEADRTGNPVRVRRGSMTGLALPSGGEF